MLSMNSFIITKGVNMNICYFGSGDFSRKFLETLLFLLPKSINISLVVTKMDREKGRGKHLQPTPVKQLATSRNIPVYDNENIRSPDFYEFLKNKKHDVYVVCDYGKIIPENIFMIPKYKTLGIHPSLLPQYRGPSPIQTALLNRDRFTGTTVFLINKDMDAGDILVQEKLEITDSDDYITLSDKLVDISVKCLIEVLRNIDMITPIPQDHSKATFTKMITKEDGKIDWTRPATYIDGQVKAFVEWPRAYFKFENRIVKILSSFVSPEKAGVPGTVVKIDNFIHVSTGENCLGIKHILPENSKPMDARSFVNGYRVKVGDIFE